MEEGEARRDEQKNKREVMWSVSERSGEWAKRTSERGYCRIIPVARVKLELVVLSAVSYIIQKGKENVKQVVGQCCLSQKNLQLMETAVLLLQIAGSQLAGTMKPTWQDPRRERGLQMTPKLLNRRDIKKMTPYCRSNSPIQTSHKI